MTVGGVTAAAGIAATGDVVVTSTGTLTVAENISVTGAGSDVDAHHDRRLLARVRT